MTKFLKGTLVCFVCAALAGTGFEAGAIYRSKHLLSDKSLPSLVGTCASTVIEGLEHRLEDSHGNPIPGSGSAIKFANGGYQVSYDEDAAVQQAEINDPVLICLIELPKDCPKGDERGRIYTTTDLRKRVSWTMGDSEHGCGGV